MIQNFNSNLAASGTVTAPSGLFDQSLTISGTAVLHLVPDPLVLSSGIYTESLTVSGIPVQLEAGGGGGSALTVKESDGSPSVANVDTIVVTDGTLTDDGSGQVTIDTGGSGGGGGGEVGRSFQGATVTTTTGVTLPDLVFHNIGWDTVTYDTSGFFDINGDVDRFTIPTGSGITHVVIRASVQWDTIAENAFIFADVHLNGALPSPAITSLVPMVEFPAGGGRSTTQNVISYPIEVVDGDYFALNIAQDNDGATDESTLAARTWFSIEDVTPSSGTGGGGGSGTITDINTTATGPSVTITGVGAITTITEGNVITISGLRLEGNSRWDPFIPPASGSPFDDEFEDGFGSAPDSSKWTTFDPGSDITELIIKENPGRLSIKQGTGGEFGGVFFDRVDADGSFTVYTYVGITTRSSRGTAMQVYAGISIIEDTSVPLTSNIILAGIHYDKTEVTADGLVPFRIGMWEFDQYDDSTETVRSSEIELPDFSTGGGVFLRLRYNNVTNPFDFDWSNDGISWHEVSQIDLDGASMTSFNAIGLFSRASSETEHTAEFSFFRLLESVNGLTNEETQLPAGILGGNIIDPDFATLTAVTGTFTESLTISGVPVSTGTGGGASTLQEAYDGGDGTISITGGKPLELTGTGELTAVTGTFTTGLTVGGASTDLIDGKITT